jgi:hypothetical protein
VSDSANLDVVRSIRAHWERGDFRASEWADPEIEFGFGDGPSPGSWTELAGMAEGQSDFLHAWEDVAFGVDEYRELDAERALVHLSRHGRGSLVRSLRPHLR